ncbi:hypothetical protein P9A54_gp76 [Xanthomonas phage vB_Xar_IVIA-DoCa10]|uniref:Uncharacterized protein n=1 Tax=Xanthomonas phage vB_Xar_IVIA-DoCa10 TaxID=2975529 RepID=A0A9X9JNF7_9CAUD|nr:hypothetical protein P9A54_gp76 [Xanthomonas phage vB_Xar_IVIA-DoCa10]UYA99061.1 hypothetical protein IVIADoCa10_76 [Xanthomonas phage vB_Xar_IVIA-DoCa10]
MDVNTFMENSLREQARQTSLLEAILETLKDMNDNGVIVANVDGDPILVAIHGAQPVTVSNVVTTKETATKAAVQETKQAAEAAAPAEQVAATQDKPAEVEKDKPAEVEKEKPAETKKKVTIDDARAALKKYAAIEGNDAAMDLLTSLNAKSVSDLAEQGPDALQKLIDKADGKNV